MTKDEAARYCGCETEAAFDKWMEKGIVPRPIRGTRRWDRKLIDLFLDRVSEINTEDEVSGGGSALEQWLANQG